MIKLTLWKSSNGSEIYVDFNKVQALRPLKINAGDINDIGETYTKLWMDSCEEFSVRETPEEIFKLANALQEDDQWTRR